MTSASFASSEGWKTSGPTEIQRRAPLIRSPTGSTPRQRESAQAVELHPGHNEEDDETRDGVGRLPLEVALRVGMAERGRARSGAVYHHEPEQDEGRRDQHEQVPLELELLRPAAHVSSCTSRRNVSPRSSKFA